MEQILVYSDSLTWGIIPNTRNRLSFHDRWPGYMEKEISALGKNVRVIENCLNGRRTAWEDPYKPGRNGLIGIQQTIEMHSPLSLVLLALGTNDFQSVHEHNSWHSAEGIRALVYEIREAPIEPGMPIPEILIVVPPEITKPMGPIAPKFEGGEKKIKGLAEAYKAVADDTNCYYFNTEDVTTASKVDGVHLDVDQHHLLGAALSEKVLSILTLTQ